jgi:hypothetical protein
MERFKEMSPNHFTPVDIILEWNNNDIMLHHGDSQIFYIDLINGQLGCEDESVDKIVLSGITDFAQGLSLILKESKRVLKKNGRLFIALGSNTQGFKLISRVRSKLGSKNSIDKIATIIAQQELLIDKNFILDNDQVYLEIVKLESDYIRRKILI